MLKNGNYEYVIRCSVYHQTKRRDTLTLRLDCRLVYVLSPFPVYRTEDAYQVILLHFSKRSIPVICLVVALEYQPATLAV